MLARMPVAQGINRGCELCTWYMSHYQSNAICRTCLSQLPSTSMGESIFAMARLKYTDRYLIVAKPVDECAVKVFSPCLNSGNCIEL